MKKNRSTLFILISSIALIAVLAIQVEWLFETAKIKEELFNEKASIVLSKTVEALEADEQACRKLEECVEATEIEKIDSLFKHYMAFYNFHINYSFEVYSANTSKTEEDTGLLNNVYKKKLDEVAIKNGLELNLILPGKKQFIMAEMGPLFITTVLLLLVVLFLFWRTVHSLFKEKKIAVHTAEYLNNMTHEFKTPLSNIALAGKLISKVDNLENPTKIKHYTSIILEENEKLRQQVEQMLSMNALERGELVMQKSIIDLHDLIREAANCMQVQIDHKKGTMSLELEAKNAHINGDKTHLLNGIYNLIDNAIKYVENEPHLSLSTYNADAGIYFKITDNGIGIDKAFHSDVFTNFFRVPTGDVHDVKGYGLGLAYLKKIVILHQGKITLKSEKGNGSTFIIYLPNA